MLISHILRLTNRNVPTSDFEEEGKEERSRGQYQGE
jgi:hypothetical protein